MRKLLSTVAVAALMGLGMAGMGANEAKAWGWGPFGNNGWGNNGWGNGTGSGNFSMNMGGSATALATATVVPATATAVPATRPMAMLPRPRLLLPLHRPSRSAEPRRALTSRA